MTTPITQELVDSNMERRHSRSSGSDSLAKVDPTNTEVRVNDPEKGTHHSAALEDEEDVSGLTRLYRRFRPFVLIALAAVILGWWVSSTVLTATRHRWCARSPRFFPRSSRVTDPPRLSRPLGSSRPFGPGFSSRESFSCAVPSHICVFGDARRREAILGPLWKSRKSRAVARGASALGAWSTAGSQRAPVLVARETSVVWRMGGENFVELVTNLALAFANNGIYAASSPSGLSPPRLSRAPLPPHGFPACRRRSSSSRTPSA